MAFFIIASGRGSRHWGGRYPDISMIFELAPIVLTLFGAGVGVLINEIMVCVAIGLAAGIAIFFAGVLLVPVFR